MRQIVLAAAAVLALAASAEAAPKAPKPPPVPTGPAEADWRTPNPQNVIVIETTKGRIIVELTPEVAPAHVARILELTRRGFYDNRLFFRVLDNFMDQTGDPQDNGSGQSELPNLQPEFMFRRGSDTPLAVVDKTGGVEIGFIGAFPVVSQTMDLGVITADHKVAAYGAYCPGVLGAAHSDEPGSANSQFFLMRNNTRAADGATHDLERQYTAFGRAIAGQDIINAIATGQPPPQPDKMLTVRVLADLPEAERPKVRVLDPRGPWFQVLAAKVRAAKVVGATICDFNLPSDVK